MTTQRSPAPQAQTSTSAWASEPRAEEEMRQRHLARRQPSGSLWLLPLFLIWVVAAIAIWPVSEMKFLTTVGVPLAMVLMLFAAAAQSAIYLLGYGVFHWARGRLADGSARRILDLVVA